MRKSKKHTHITIAVVAYFGKDLLIKTIESILSTTPKHIHVTLLTIPNGISLDLKTREYLKLHAVTIVPNKVEKGLTYRIKQAINQCADEFLILTQDGIGFTLTTLENTLQSFNDEEVTITSSKVEPSHARSLGERVTEVRSLLKTRIGNNWRRKDNYLMLNSQFIGLRMSFAAMLQIPDSVNNISTYLYLENKHKKGKFRFVFNSLCTNQRPQSIYSYIDWRKSLESTQDEMNKHFDLNGREFNIPKLIVLESIFLEFVNRPIPTLLYFIVLTYIKATQYTFALNGKIEPIKTTVASKVILTKSRLLKFTSVPPKRKTLRTAKQG